MVTWRAAVDRDGDANHRAAVHLKPEGTILQLPDQAAHRLLGIGMDVTHIGGDDIAAMFGAGRLKPCCAAPGGDLGGKIADVLIDITGRPAPEPSNARSSSSQKRPSSTSRTLSIRTPSSSMLVLVGGIDPGAIPPTSAWCPRGDEEAGHRTIARNEDRSDHGNVRQVGTPGVGRVEDIGITAADSPAIAPTSAPPQMIRPALSPIEPRWTGILDAQVLGAAGCGNCTMSCTSTSLFVTTIGRRR